MRMILAVAVGGAVGAVGRYLIAAQALRLLGLNFPWGTLTVNVLGSFAMGVIVELSALRLSLSPPSRAFLVIGLLGGFTTFSAFSLDVSVLLERNEISRAALYALMSVVLSAGALFAGLAVTRSWL